MKLIRRTIISLAVIYGVFWLGFAAYFSFAEQHKELLEANLSAVFKRDVTIKSVITTWRGLSPTIQISDFNVKGDSPDLPALAFDSLSVELSPFSLLRFWPKLTEFVVDRPRVEIVTLDANHLQIAGLELKSNRSSGVNPRRLISWALNHQSAVWLNGEVVWRRLNGERQHYTGISFVYERQQQDRSIDAVARTPKGGLAFRARANGDVLKADNWNASLEVLDNQRQPLLSPRDLSLKVENGKGRLALKTLDVQRIRDFLRLTGIGGTNNWVLTSQLSGRLHDVEFEFSGPLLDFEDWSLTALASEVGFNSVGRTPAMSNLHGKLKVRKQGGQFEFSAVDAVFDWPRWFERPFPIDQAMGQFEWSLATNGEILVTLKDGFFQDKTVTLSNLNAVVELDTNKGRVDNIADLFKVVSIADLSFKDGKVVDQKELDGFGSVPLVLDANAEFEVSDLKQIERYLPKDPRIVKFHTWWKNAFLSGRATEGKIKYVGEVSKDAIYVGKAQLNAQARFSELEIDYGYQRGWPRLVKARGLATIDNALFTAIPDEAWIEDDKVDNAIVQISSLFRLDRTLSLQASMSSSLATVMDFLFAGPLLPPGKAPKPLPVKAEDGTVSANVEIIIPLRSVRNSTVAGSARVIDGRVLLPAGIPVSDIQGDIGFTERSVESNNIRASFLGGNASGTLVTTQVAQPPKLKFAASGTAQSDLLEPWIGEHILSLIDGKTDWEGTVLVDGPMAEITAVSTLSGISINVPAPLKKQADQEDLFSLSMQVGADVPQTLSVSLGDVLSAKFAGDVNLGNQLFDRSIIGVGDLPDKPLALGDGINFDINYDQIDIDDWLEALIALAKLETRRPRSTLFLDSMRSIKLRADTPFFLGRQSGAVDFSTVSVDGDYWIGTINGENISGTLQAQPRSEVGNYRFNLSRLHLVETPPDSQPLEPIDQALLPSSYPQIELNARSFHLAGKALGRLELLGKPVGDVWELSRFSLAHNGINTSASGQWVNDAKSGTMSSFNYETIIDEAGNALDDMDFDGLVKKGNGSITGSINWIGAPHEFEYSRLNGDFDMRIKNGELVKVEPGSGKLLGLLNFNAIARRMTLNFRDLFATGLEFDRMRYAGVFADGEAIMRDAFIFTPAVFVQMEGKINLDKELIDMEIHISPELGGNLTLLSALANPAAGAVVFLTQQIFKDDLRSARFKSYRALGTWEDFELKELDDQNNPLSEPKEPEPPASKATSANNTPSANKNTSSAKATPAGNEAATEPATPQTPDKAE